MRNLNLTKLTMYDTIGMIKKNVKNRLRKIGINIELTFVQATATAIAIAIAMTI